MTDHVHIAKSSIRGHEGLELKPYKCTADKTSIAYGRNLDDKGLTLEEAEYLLDNDVAECIQDLSTFSYWNKLSERRRACLIDLRFCLGPGGYRQFRRMAAAIERDDYEEAAEQILDSRFAQQTGRRADNLALMMREG